ncbi:hypothetical protein IQ283_14705 [Alkalihalobacillus hwajinpoensis]|uniref:hypothetical protein n=1 Tax=Guptibacillus hwajinpoensis TaxID=208199 RepID=UPI00188467FA|nr:hypothetical protein [Pseudalkalibacillus hwajinpoensis]MBF0707846.1 hypothetical protein [Pseudalkalibacillus hwajinpoensis]
MKNERNSAKMFYLAIGIIGLVLIAVVFLRMQIMFDNQPGAFGLMISFFLILTYIEFLEKKAGLSRKYRWTRAMGSMVLLTCLTIYIYL